MKILLINSNPVVSRLTALSARKEGVDLDEIRDIADLKKSDYNIVFVDSELLSPEILTLLKNSDIKRRVIFYTQDDKNIDKIFNYTILKPFLPSEVSSILREAKMELDEEEYSKKTPPPSKPKEEYLNLNDIISTKKEDLEPIKTKEDNKFNILKGSEEELLKELKASKNIDKPKEEKLDLDDNLFIKKETKDRKENITKSELFELDDKKDDNIELFSLDRDSSRDIKNEILALDMDSSNEVKLDKLEKETPKDTKVLDKEDKLNIQSLLDNKESSDNNEKNLSTNDIDDVNNKISSTTPDIDINRDKEREIKPKKSTKTDKVMKKVFKDTVGSLPIEELRQLLRGTKIHITIEFPKEV